MVAQQDYNTSSGGTTTTNESYNRVKTKLPDIPMPSHINKQYFDESSNFFIGNDSTSVIRAFFSLRTFIGIGYILAVALSNIFSFQYVLLVGACLTVPQLAYFWLKRWGIVADWIEARHPVIRGRQAAVIDGDYCVFLIGIRVNSGIPTSTFAKMGEAFDAMHKELEAAPEKWGYLGASNYNSSNSYVDSLATVQYWRSMEHLDAYARSSQGVHLKAMRWSAAYMRDNYDIGFWHESYPIKANSHDAIYVNMPAMLLGKAGTLVPAVGKMRTARGRAGHTDGNDLDETVILQPSS